MNWKFDFSPDTSADQMIRPLNRQVKKDSMLKVALSKYLHMMGNALAVDEADNPCVSGLEVLSGRRVCI